MSVQSCLTVVSGEGSTDCWGLVSGTSGGDDPADSVVGQAVGVGVQHDVLEVQPQLADLALSGDGVLAGVDTGGEGGGVVLVGDVGVVLEKQNEKILFWMCYMVMIFFADNKQIVSTRYLYHLINFDRVSRKLHSTSSLQTKQILEQ